ncbi:MAG: putative RDD family membrane protein YckC [Patiriisocius sp.]|jgi:uncharacterized RDD family membrane protein YckC
MKKITINTTQNVRIEYELASLRDRFLAWFLDQILISVLILILTFLFSDIAESETMYVVYCVAPVLLFYTILMEVLNHGQTVGKMALGIKVVRLDGKHPELLDFIIRWSFRMIDIWFTAGSLAAIYVNSTVKAQRLGGIVSNTTVIRINSRNGFQLSKLTEIETIENYQLTYPKVVSFFTENDMILIKKVIERTIKYPNEAHRLAIKETVARVEEKMDIKNDKPSIVFLKTVLKDYIILSR